MKLSGEAWSVGVIAAQPKPPTPIRHEEEGPGTATVLTLGVHMCRWPIGDPQDDGFTLCGRRKADGASYCVAHGQLAHRPRQAKHSAGELARSLRRYL
jgi:GcrA cell cycle regulator